MAAAHVGCRRRAGVAASAVAVVAVVLALLLVGGAGAASNKPTSASSASGGAAAAAASPPASNDDAASSSRLATKVITLTDAVFEKLTQATTGSTTGDWYVSFVSETCAACTQFRATWESVARELEGRINVAEVNGDLNRATVRRFNVTQYPSVIFIRKGLYYPYDDFRTLRPLVDFAETKYKSTTGIAVKPMASWWYGAAWSWVPRRSSSQATPLMVGSAPAVAFYARAIVGPPPHPFRDYLQDEFDVLVADAVVAYSHPELVPLSLVAAGGGVGALVGLLLVLACFDWSGLKKAPAPGKTHSKRVTVAPSAGPQAPSSRVPTGQPPVTIRALGETEAPEAAAAKATTTGKVEAPKASKAATPAKPEAPAAASKTATPAKPEAPAAASKAATPAKPEAPAAASKAATPAKPETPAAASKAATPAKTEADKAATTPTKTETPAATSKTAASPAAEAAQSSIAKETATTPAKEAPAAHVDEATPSPATGGKGGKGKGKGANAASPKTEAAASETEKPASEPTQLGSPAPAAAAAAPAPAAATPTHAPTVVEEITFPQSPDADSPLPKETSQTSGKRQGGSARRSRKED